MIKIMTPRPGSLREFVPIEEGKVRMYVWWSDVFITISMSAMPSSTVAFDTVRRLVLSIWDLRSIIFQFYRCR